MNPSSAFSAVPRLRHLPVLGALALLAGLQDSPAVSAPYPSRPAAELRAEVVKVVDGDTLDVLLDGERITLRLLSVDTEEKITGRASSSITKPETVFGEETKLWTQEFFAALPRDEPGQPVRIGLAFPEGRRLDAYGRLLCHVLLSDGRDFNRLLVETGRSPYFNKYGNSLVEHAAFVRAQEAARAAGLGIWNPATNRAKTPGAPSAVRPYARLLPWWDARAAAIDAFRQRVAREGEALVSAEDPAALRRAFESCQRDPELRVTVFAEIERFYDEADGSLTALLHPGNAESALRASLAAAERAELEPLLRASAMEFRQNYLYVRGRMERNARGFLLTGATRADWQLAEPAYPPPEVREPK